MGPPYTSCNPILKKAKKGNTALTHLSILLSYQYFKMASYLQHKIVNDKLTIFTFNDEIDERQVRIYFIKNWETLTLGMDGSTILFIGGIHGKDSGKFGPNEDI